MQTSTKKRITKRIVRMVAGYCAMTVTEQVIINNINPPQTTSDKVIAKVGVVAVGSATSYAVGKYTDKLIDELFDIASE